MTCPLEKRMAALLKRHNIEFTRPERDPGDPVKLDFYLPVQNIYIELKQFHTDRIARQLASVPSSTTAIVLQGVNAVQDFELLCRLIGQWRVPAEGEPPIKIKIDPDIRSR